MKRILIIKTLLVALLVLLPGLAKGANVVLNLATENGWTIEDGQVTISFTLDRNVVKWGAGGSLSNANCCNPIIEAKIKNNSDEFIYLDMGKTYILRNGEAQLLQNIVAMSSADTKKGEEEGISKALSQTVMPIPPHSSKTFKFPVFASMEYGEDTGYEPFVRKSEHTGFEYPFYVLFPKNEVGQTRDYTLGNSPFVTTISFAYTKTEDQKAPTRLTKEFYVDKAYFLKNSKEKELKKVGAETTDTNFVVWGRLENNASKGASGLGGSLGGLIGR